jgi:hypothetical protein
LDDFIIPKTGSAAGLRGLIGPSPVGGLQSVGHPRRGSRFGVDFPAGSGFGK